MWFHPRRGAIITTSPLRPDVLRYRGGEGSLWREVMKLRVELNEYQQPRPVAGQKLPRGFLWGEPAKQRFGMGGPEEVFGPLDKICRDCKEPFVYTAAAQKHLLEETGAFVDATAVRCLACSQRKQKLEQARRAHAAALDAVAALASAAAPASDARAATYLAAARAALALLEAGGKTSLERAIGHARKARKLGAKAGESVEQKLAARRAAAAEETARAAASAPPRARARRR